MAKYIRLTLSERRQIVTFLDMKKSIRQIADKLGRSPSSISREIRRNKTQEKYQYAEANQIAKSRFSRRPNKLDTDKRLHNWVIERLRKDWGPEQIAGDLKRKQSSFYVCSESIYRYVYKRLDLEWYKLLRKQRKKRRSNRLQKNKAKYACPKRNSIEKRSPIVEKRQMAGHWEADTIRFAGSRVCVTTLVERTSRLMRLQLNSNAKSVPVIDKIKSLIQSSNKKTWKSITFDNGSEFKFYRPLEVETNCKIYFAHPYSPWERGTNENTNGRLRRYLPRKMDPRQITPEFLKEIENRLNNTPRKCLTYQTPIEVFRGRKCCIRM